MVKKPDTGIRDKELRLAAVVNAAILSGTNN